MLKTLRAYYRASDSATECTLMSRRFISVMSEVAPGEGCAAALDELSLRRFPKREAEVRQLIKALRPASVFLTGNTASFEVPGEYAALVREDGKWLVDGNPDNARELTVFTAAQLEAVIKDYYEGGGNIVIVKKAACPPNEPVRVGDVFNCVLEFGAGSRAVMSAEVRNLRGRLKFLGLHSLPE